ncbi:MAG TPA: SgcJ/EcaC family oxidoreductase [Ilumatobacteraceae bacterium]|nr:SgcJ/EcaC family oxidoreductase [Ilumatobacteraceae bacterium]
MTRTESREILTDLRAIPKHMIEAWNRGDAAGFAHACTDTTDFIAFEGTHLVGREGIIAFHQPLFDSVLAGSRLHGDVRFVRLLGADWAIIHAYVDVVLPGHVRPSPGRTSMQLFVVHRELGEWRIEAVQNCRQVTLERQLLLDDIDSLPSRAQELLAQLLGAIPNEV